MVLSSLQSVLTLIAMTLSIPPNTYDIPGPYNSLMKNRCTECRRCTSVLGLSPERRTVRVDTEPTATWQTIISDFEAPAHEVSCKLQR